MMNLEWITVYFIHLILLSYWSSQYFCYPSQSALPNWISGKGDEGGYESCSAFPDHLALNGRAFNQKTSNIEDLSSSPLKTLRNVLTKVKSKIEGVKSMLSPNGGPIPAKNSIIHTSQDGPTSTQKTVSSSSDDDPTMTQKSVPKSPENEFGLNGIYNGDQKTSVKVETLDTCFKRTDPFNFWPSKAYQFCPKDGFKEVEIFDQLLNVSEEVNITSKKNDSSESFSVSGNKTNVAEGEFTTGDVLSPGVSSGTRHDENVSEITTRDDQLETYSQFAERVKAEEQKTLNSVNGVHSTSNGQPPKDPKKVKPKNYASPDCGAKFLSASAESSHAHKGYLWAVETLFRLRLPRLCPPWMP